MASRCITREQQNKFYVCRLSQIKGSIRIIAKRTSHLKPRIRSVDEVSDPPVYTVGRTGPKTPSQYYFLVRNPGLHVPGYRVYFEVVHDET